MFTLLKLICMLLRCFAVFQVPYGQLGQPENSYFL